MKFKEWKAGDEAFLVNLGWIVLEPLDNPLYPLQFRDYSFTKDGRQWDEDRYPSLLDHNPFDPNDPKNPPESRYPFMLNGRPVFAGSELHHLGYRKTSVVTALFLEDGKQWCGLKNTSVGELSPKNFCWPDEIPAKKKVAKWAYPVIGMPGVIRIEFTDEMTKEEAEKKFGSFLFMVPGTEGEVEG